MERGPVKPIKLPMPFTISHTAAILPFVSKRLPLSALAIGATSPDFEYMLRMRAHAEWSHTPAGILLFCLPAGLLALWIFHALLKVPLTRLAPAPLQERLVPMLAPFPFAPVARFATLSACIVLGAATHVVWDSFTHPDGWTVQRVPLLQATTFPTPYGTPHVYRILQHGSTVFGLVLLLAVFVRWFRTTPPQSESFPTLQTACQRAAIIATLALTAAAIALTASALRFGLPHDFDSLRKFSVQTTIAGMSSGAVVCVIYALIVRRAHRASAAAS